MEKLVLCGHATDNCTYCFDWTRCFEYESKKKAKDDFEMLWIKAIDNESNFTFCGETIWTNDYDCEDYKFYSLEEWFELNKVK